jgi:hypothetical protein
MITWSSALSHPSWGRGCLDKTKMDLDHPFLEITSDLHLTRVLERHRQPQHIATTQPRNPVNLLIVCKE